MNEVLYYELVQLFMKEFKLDRDGFLEVFRPGIQGGLLNMKEFTDFFAWLDEIEGVNMFEGTLARRANFDQVIHALGHLIHGTDGDTLTSTISEEVGLIKSLGTNLELTDDQTKSNTYVTPSFYDLNLAQTAYMLWGYNNFGKKSVSDFGDDIAMPDDTTRLLSTLNLGGQLEAKIVTLVDQSQDNVYRSIRELSDRLKQRQLGNLPDTMTKKEKVDRKSVV